MMIKKYLRASVKLAKLQSTAAFSLKIKPKDELFDDLFS